MPPLGNTTTGAREPCAASARPKAALALDSWPFAPRPCRNTSSGRPFPPPGGSAATWGSVRWAKRERTS